MRRALQLRAKMCRAGAVALASAVGIAAGATGPGAVAGATKATLAQACADGGWVRLGGVESVVTSLAGTTEFEFMFGGGLDEIGTRVYRGEAADTSWTAVPAMDAVRVTDIALGPGVDPAIYVAQYHGPVHESRTGGTSFGALPALPAERTTALAAVTNTVLAAASGPTGRGVYAWDGASATWTLRGASNIATEFFFDLEATTDGQLWLATDSQGLLTSIDGGTSWRPVAVAGRTDTSILDVALDPADAARIYVAHVPRQSGSVAGPAALGVHISHDGGSTWRNALTDVPIVVAVVPLALKAGSAYAAAWGRGLLVTRDAGATWRTAPTAARADNLDAPLYVESLAAFRPRGIAPDCELLLAGRSDGLWAFNPRAAAYTSLYLPSLTHPCVGGCPGAEAATAGAVDRRPARLRALTERPAAR